MAGNLLDIYESYNRAMDQYNREGARWDDLYVGRNDLTRDEYDLAMATKPVEPMRPDFPEYGYGEPLRAVSPYELYQTAFGRGTPDVLTNEAWSLANISTPFLASSPETAYDKGQVAKINNPLSYAGPQEFYTGQTDETNQNTMQGQNIFY